MRLKSTTGNQELLKKNNMEHIIRSISKKNIVCEIGTVNTSCGGPPPLIEVNRNLGYYVDNEARCSGYNWSNFVSVNFTTR